MDNKKSFSSYEDFLGKEVHMVIDRPLGSVHPSHSDIVYKVNYGYVPDTLAEDGEEVDVYLLGVKVPVRDYVGQIIAVIKRHDDNESKLVATPFGVKYSEEEIRELTHFQEKYFNSEIIM